MKIGIVGSEGYSFTELGQQRAREEIRKLISPQDIDFMVSGNCPEGGIDIWAEEESSKEGVAMMIFPPGRVGCTRRNLQIAENSDVVVTIQPDKSRADATPRLCYFCGTDVPGHIPSGGCWTGNEARKMGKEFRTVIVENF